ncbi:MAG: sulfatase [bacterium]|nr:sulfatase [bacterium]
MKREPANRFPVISLLSYRFLINDETELRSPFPEPSRLIINNESVEGWSIPDASVLRFSMIIHEGGILSCRLGITGDFLASNGDLIFKIDFIEKYTDENRVCTDRVKNTFNLYEASLLNNPSLRDSWTQIDIPMTNSHILYGDLRFSVEGNLENHPELTYLWGAPTLYFPDMLEKKNILLIGVDTLRADMLTVYGEPQNLTPVIAEFAQSSTTFMQNRSQSPWTLPSFASMITGGLPSRIGATMLSWSLPGRATSIAEILRDNGYATGTVCSNTYIGNSSSGFQQGMDSFWYSYNVRADVSIQRAEDFINRSKDRDWFCFLHFEDPHTPFTPLPEFAARWCDPSYTGEFKTAFTEDADWKFSSTVPPEADIDQVRNLYRSEISYLDSSLAELFNFLEENNLMDNTLIIFSGDHGEEFYEHGAFEHGHTHYDELVKTPLIIQGEGFPEGEKISDLTGNTDIVPTILRWLNIPLLDDLEGVPLQDVVAGTVPDDRIIYGEDNIRGTQRKYALQWPYKCIYDYSDRTCKLFNLEDDPGELTDISSLNPEISSSLIYKIITKMLSDKSTFNVWFMGSFIENPHLFTGTLRVPGGIDSVLPFALSGDDTWTLEGDTIIFSITNADPSTNVDKHFVIVPSEDADTLEIEFLVDGEIHPEKLFPLGTNVSAESNSVSVKLTDFPLVANIPTGENAFSGAMYVWGILGLGEILSRNELDPESIAILKSLGYIPE